MLPYIEITENFQLPSYGVMAIVGFTLAVAVAFYVASIVRVHEYDVLFGSLYAGIGLIIGAKVIYFISVLPRIVERWVIYKSDFMQLLVDGFGGFVFYGGLIGSLIGIYVYCKRVHMPVGPFYDIAVTAIPVMHGIGRIGCLMAGCCYGMEYDGPFAITFPENELIAGLAGVSRFPMQIIEVIYNVLLFVVIFILIKRRTLKNGRVLGLYLMAYSFMRFILEFYRGDVIRGSFNGLSTSQWISLVVFPIGCYILFAKKNLFEKQ